MDCMQAIQKRYSYRGMYKQDPVPREDLERIMEAGLSAPSGCNAQTTSLIGVDDPALLRRLGGMLRKPHFASAPAAICVLTEPRAAYENTRFHVQDYSAAIENMLLAITALGYESCWIEGYVTGASGVGAEMARALGAPAGLSLVAYLPVGLAAEETPRAVRKPFSQRAWLNGYGGDAE